MSHRLHQNDELARQARRRAAAVAELTRLRRQAKRLRARIARTGCWASRHELKQVTGRIQQAQARLGGDSRSDWWTYRKAA